MLKRVVLLVRIVFLFAKDQNHCRQCIFCFKHIIFIRQKCFRSIVDMNYLTAESEVYMVGNDLSSSRSTIVC